MTDPALAAQLADRIARAVTGCPAVVGLARGPVGTYLPGRVIPGVAVRDHALGLAVVTRYGVPIAELDQQVRAAVQPLVPGWAVDVSVEDVADAHVPG